MPEIYEQEEASIGVAEIRYAIEAGRGERTEFYATIPENEDRLAVTACSLANNGGGQILIGVDKEGNRIGIDSPNVEEIVKEVLDRNLERRRDRKYFTSVEETNNCNILIIIIDEFKDFPLMADGRFYIRHQRDDLLLTPVDVFYLMRGIEPDEIEQDQRS
ncbi:RNA-binding domain-containing protein [Natrinema sp. SYSU A 869]|uniref:AlbA family DNA-binding domain-containing protein n=1 Tax=Natrinema sp. SYSU A 869 TaxID=2871694 RepID=UPI001CA3D151|nr:RNA-binding domain-containing protein [Natrinema sp. SYSU A 869]